MLRRQVSDWRERAGCLKGVAPWKCPLLHPPDLCQRFLVANASRLPAPHAGPGDVPEAGWPRGLGVWLPGVAWGGGMAGLHVAQGAHGGGGPGSNCVAKPLQHGCSEAIPGDLLGPIDPRMLQQAPPWMPHSKVHMVRRLARQAGGCTGRQLGRWRVGKSMASCQQTCPLHPDQADKAPGFESSSRHWGVWVRAIEASRWQQGARGRPRGRGPGRRNARVTRRHPATTCCPHRRGHTAPLLADQGNGSFWGGGQWDLTRPALGPRPPARPPAPCRLLPATWRR